MENNLFTELKAKKEKLKLFADDALSNKWISKEDYQNIIRKLENDTLTLGVIGQMKCGKSTFLNAFIFEDEVLPAATTPMTAALSVITYGETKSVEAEFYDKNEWAELQMQAERSLEDAEDNQAELSKIKAAKELVEKSRRLGNISNLLGKKQADNINNLVEYVGADGKYVAITKSVTIHYPKEWLKGVEIVDTPGFNDPVVSREERTQEFLKKADVVLLMLYAGRAFDATDRDIVFEKVRSVGVGRILIGVNKYDLCYKNGETVEEISGNVTNEIKKACRDYKDTSVTDMLRDEKPVLFSASMALMAKMSMERIRKDSDLTFHWKEACDTFEISSQSQMLDKSLIGNLENAVRSVIERSKYDILFSKPMNMIIQAGQNIKDKIQNKLVQINETIKNLEMPDDELEEKKAGLEKAQKRIERKIARAVDDLSEEYDNQVNQIIRNLEDITNDVHKEADRIIETEKKSAIEHRLKVTFDAFKERKLPRTIEDSLKNLTKLLCDKADELCEEISDVLDRFVEEPDDMRELFISKIKKSARALESERLDYSFGEDKDNETSVMAKVLFAAAEVFCDVVNGLTWHLPEFITGYRKGLTDDVDTKFSRINFNDLKDKLISRRQSYVNLLGTESVKEIMPAMMKQIDEIQQNQDKKQKSLAKAKDEKKTLDNEMTVVTKQFEKMNTLKSQIL